MNKYYTVEDYAANGALLLILTDWAMEVDLNGELLDIDKRIGGIVTAFNMYEELRNGFMIIYEENQVSRAAILEAIDRIIAQIEMEMAE